MKGVNVLQLRRLLRKLLLRDRSLMTKLTAYSALFVIVPMLLVGTVAYRESSRTHENESRQYSWQIIEQVKHYVEEYLRDFEINTLKIVNHPDTVAFLKLKTLQEVNDTDLVPAVRDVLKNSAYSRSDVTNITLILDHVQEINSAVQEGVTTVEHLEEEYWYDTIPISAIPQVYSRVIEWNGRQEPVLSIVKRIVNPQTLKPFGMLVIDVNYKRLHEVARKIRLGEYGHGYLFILDAQGHFVYHPNTALVGTKADPVILRSIAGESSGSFIAEVEGTKQMFTFSRSDSLNWQLVTSIPYDELMRSSKYIGRTIFGTTAAFTVLALILSLGLAASYAKPIRRLYQYMKRVEIGDFSSQVPVHTTDEIGMLSAGFNKMVARLSQLLEESYISKLREAELHLRQKETELKMLQAQINPHFLYNSLETIRGMALEHDLSEIGDMSAALARLLRYNIKNSETVVTVGQEIEIIVVYLRIQQYRFEDRLEYEIAVPAWALQQQINRFTLQPIVENSIVHGMERRLGKTRVRVSAQRIDEDRFEVRVTDNGPGIPAESLSELRRLLDKEEAEDTHIGMLNVHRRIRHVLGKRYGLQVTSVEGEGTEVSVVLPYDSTKGEMI